jgi:hypothetical protein
MKSLVVLTSSLLAFAVPAALAAPLQPGQFAGSISAGAEFTVDGDVHGGATSSVPLAAVAALRDAGAPPLVLPPEASGAELRIQPRSFEDIYGAAFNITLQGAYGLQGEREVFVALGYTSTGGDTIDVGTAAVVSGTGATLVEVPVTGTFEDYTAWTLEAGLRQYFGVGLLRPYVAGRLGVAFVDEINASFRVPAIDINSALDNVPFYSSTSALIGGIDVGIAYDLSDRFSLELESGVRFFGSLDGDDAAIAGLGLAAINEEGSRTAIPVSIRARWRF